MQSRTHGSPCYHRQQNVYRFLRSDRVLFLFHAALLEPPIVWVNLCPLPRPRDFLPADVRPRISRCFITGLHSQLIFASRRIALWNGSTRITSKNLYVESWATQYEFNTRRALQCRPTRSCNRQPIAEPLRRLIHSFDHVRKLPS